ncbi:hypothetical protein [Xanthobacter sp. 126]|uniref:hypothetical protein n=1 Tax=Xanthobacter sp. 126 TaxID=1131814 RepID=UPI001FD88C5B|nr:hypothetical protein [Xanthobacter sp. 126]
MREPRTLSRRGVLLGTAALSIGVTVAGASAVAAHDPVFAVIAAHAAARARLNEMDSTDAGWDAALDEEGALWDAFCACRPATPGGLAAYAAHAAVYPDLEVLTGRYGPAQIITNMSAALRSLAVGGAHV